LSGRIEDSFRRRLEPLPEDTRRLLVVAAAEPLGDPLLLMRAASHLGLPVEAADAAEDAGLLEIRERVSFRHPLVRSAVYGAASQAERRQAHAALAETSDPQLDPDRKAWHRAEATAAPDEDVAAELERTAVRAKSRGGLAAAGAFLERSAVLTPDPGSRAERVLAAAEVLYEAGSFSQVESLLRALDSRQLGQLEAARPRRLHARVALSLGRAEKEAILRLLAAADQLLQLEPSLADATHLEALKTAFFFMHDSEIREAVSRALDEAGAPDSGAVQEPIVRGWAQLLRQGYPAGTDTL